MDTARRQDGHGGRAPQGDPTEGGVGEPEVKIGGDERRMHVRAYNHWVSLLRDRAYPSIADLDPASIADFGPHSVLLDFTGGLDNPAIQYIGRALRDECAVDHTITRINQVPARSLLSRLTDQYLQIIANRAPVGFEAEFVGTRGHATLYRGILMPFSSDEQSIDYVYGVINWKEMVSADQQAQLTGEVADALRVPPRAEAAAWADGPGAGSEEALRSSLDERLAQARESAATARTAHARSHAALYRALGRAHDFATAAARDEAALATLLAAEGIRAQPRARMTAVAKLIFGADHDKTRLAEIACVLGHAARTKVPEGALPRLIETAPGGIKGLVAAERAARRPAARAAMPLAERAALGNFSLAGLRAGAPVVLLGRATESGQVEVVGSVHDDQRLSDRVLRRLR
jgi:hypothetical protein